MRVNIPDFVGDTLSLEGFIDWLVAIEEVFEFKEVPENKRVSLIATKLHGRASAWWQQLKLTRERIMDSVNKFDPMTLSDAYQHALAFKKQNCRMGSSSSLAITGASGSEAPVYDEEPECEEEYISGDVGCDNLIVAEAVQKLGLKTGNHPKPYKLQWLKKGGEVTVSKRVHVSFSVGNTYKDNVLCDVVPMDACHLLLCRPWEYDNDITHNGRTNTYSFLFRGVKITLMPNKPKEVVSKSTSTLLTLSQFKDELEMGDDVFVLIGDEVAEDS
ncbi:hypothetical protein Tco_0917851 [Tanacetum coccineum]